MPQGAIKKQIPAGFKTARYVCVCVMMVMVSFFFFFLLVGWGGMSFLSILLHVLVGSSGFERWILLYEIEMGVF